IENPKKGMQVYPNPVHDILHFDMDETADISIKNLAGVTIMQQSGTNQIDVNNLPVGLYFYELKAATFSASGNFLKN
ncbi:MAG: T9SS type A sorting domain-containing protein, partial [Chitinophagales bacterium]